MGNRQISLILVFLLLCPLFIGVQADGENELNFESQNFTAGYDSVNETTTLSWGNADTNDYLVLEELKTTNYTLYRSDEPLNTSNYPQSEMIQDGIQACLALDSFTECKERTHHVVYEVPPSTDGNYYYGVTSTLENGTVISNFSEGDGGLVQPIQEYGSPITSPYNLQASYDLENATTHLSWIDASSVDSSLSLNHTTSIWSHDSVVNRSNWNQTNKTEVAANLSSDVISFEIAYTTDVSRTNFYSVLHDFDGDSDLRFLSGNTLENGLVEDNIGSSITGVLQVDFNYSNNVTSLNWTGSVIEDVNHTLHIWRSPTVILDLDGDGVQEIAQLPANTTHHNYSVAPEYSGTSYYMITLSDALGNQQTAFNSAPKAHLYEFTLMADENIVQDLSATFTMGTTQLAWSDLSNHPEAKYQIWRSNTSSILTASLLDGTAELLGIVGASVEHYNHTVVGDVSENAWYAVTVVASFGTQNVSYAQTNITLSLNSLSQPLVEDTTSPEAPAILSATYQPNGSTLLSWSGSVNETGTMWMLYRNLNTDLNEESFWVQVGSMENSGLSIHTISVDTVAQADELINAVYAIGAIDSFGNTITLENWTLSSSVREDRQPPQVQMKLFDSSNALEASRWFTGGEDATFSNLEIGNYSMQIATGDDVESILYTLSTEQSPKTLNQAAANPSIELVLSENLPNLSIAFVVTDKTGNSISFDVLFCNACLIQPQVIVDTNDATTKEDNSMGSTDSSNNENILLGISVLLGAFVVFLLTRGAPRSKPSKGLPSRDEDQWISKYTGKQ
tara:strand:- start:3633 stop:6008 length:2376 start_codon:yes stop_codon:yes gene_type:complete